MRNLSIKRKILISIALVTLIPSLVFLNLYWKNLYIWLPTKLIILIIVILGWWIIFDIFLSIIKLHNKTKRIIKGVSEESINIPNEVESLEKLLNVLSSKVKTNYEQLEDLSQKTEELNKDVSEKVFILSTILQANILTSKGVPTEEVIQFLIKRLEEILILKFSSCAVKTDKDQLRLIACFGIETRIIEKILEEDKDFLLSLNELSILDKKNQSSIYLKFVNQLFCNSFIISPLRYKNSILGVIILGSRDEFIKLDEDKKNVLLLFAQNISLIWRHNQLLVKTEELEIVDYLTDLYSERYIKMRLEEEINRSIVYQRPCGFILLEIKNYKSYEKEFGVLEAEKLLKRLARLLKENLRPIDIAGRFGLNRLAAIIIEKNKKQLQSVLEELRNKLDPIFKDKIFINYSIAEIPIDGITSQEIISFAQNTLNSKDEIL